MADPKLSDLMSQVQTMIETEERLAIPQEGWEPREWTDILDRPIARMLALFIPKPETIADHRIRGEVRFTQTTRIISETGTTDGFLASGTTTLRAVRRQRLAHAKAHAFLSRFCSTNFRWELMYELAVNTYEAMAVCKRNCGDNTQLLLCVRQQPLIIDEGAEAVSFPCLPVRPQESLKDAFLRVVVEKLGIRQITKASDWAMYRTLAGGTMTFGAFCAADQRASMEELPRSGRGATTNAWVPESIVRDAISSEESAPLIKALRESGVRVADNTRIEQSAIEIYRSLARRKLA